MELSSPGPAAGILALKEKVDFLLLQGSLLFRVILLAVQGGAVTPRHGALITRPCNTSGDR
jgi:hypothetical protein